MINITGLSFNRNQSMQLFRSSENDGLENMLMFFVNYDNALYRKLVLQYGNAEKAIDGLYEYQCDRCGKIDIVNKIENVCERCREECEFI